MKPKFFIETYGCEMNKAESGALGAELMAIGYQEAEKAEEAEWLIINTCSVRQTAEDRVWGRLGYFKTLKKADAHKKIAIMGCMAERLKTDEKLFKTFKVDEAIGNFDKKLFVAKLTGKTLAKAEAENEYSFFQMHQSQHSLKAYIPIMHGCNNFCSYCIVPYLRGREISRNSEEIEAEIEAHLAQGVKEIILLGQNVNSYCYNGLTFPALLKSISREVQGKFWLRYTSSHPKDFHKELVTIMANDERFCHHLHLAAQHGSNRVLKEMNRNYSAEHYSKLLVEARAIMPDIEFSTDLMVGFPGEADDDFEELLRFVEKSQFNDAFTYQYNDRAGVVAAQRSDKISEAIKQKRLKLLIELQRRLSQQRLTRRVGQTVEVLVEHASKKAANDYFGYNQYNENVIIKNGKNDAIGQFIQVKIEKVSGQTLIGSVL